VEFRHQLTAYSPITFQAMARAAGSWSAIDDPRDRLGSLLQERFRADRVLLVGSGTEALQIAIRTAREWAGQEAPVAVPAYTCYDVGAAALGAGAGTVFFDIDPDTLQPDLDSVRLAMMAGARVVVVSPLYGYPVDWERLARCVADHEGVLIEDAAQGHGACWRGAPLGSWGDISTLSFGRGKGWTGASGGAVLLRGSGKRLAGGGWHDSPSASNLAVLLSAAAQWGMGRPELYGIPASVSWLGLGETRFRSPASPRGIPRAAAALLLQTRQAAEEEGRRRRDNAHACLEALRGTEHVKPIVPLDGAEPGFLRLPIRLPGGFRGLRNGDRARRLGIAPGYPGTLPAVPEIRACKALPDFPFPGAERLADELLTLPVHSRVSEPERAAVLELLRASSL
jgi:perosamine synthetase